MAPFVLRVGTASRVTSPYHPVINPQVLRFFVGLLETPSLMSLWTIKNFDRSWKVIQEIRQFVAKVQGWRGMRD
jgi:hypothetical protein